MKDNLGKKTKQDPRFIIRMDELTSIFSLIQDELEKKDNNIDKEVCQINSGDLIRPELSSYKTNN